MSNRSKVLVRLTIIGLLFLVSSTPTVSFIQATTFELTSSEQSVCAILTTGELWRIGNEADNLIKFISDNIQVWVDGQIIPHENLHPLATLDLIIRYDPFGLGMALGSHNGSITTCFEAQALSAGAHEATIRAYTTLGEVYSYTWTFYTK